MWQRSYFRLEYNLPHSCSSCTTSSIFVFPQTLNKPIIPWPPFHRQQAWSRTSSFLLVPTSVSPPRPRLSIHLPHLCHYHEDHVEQGGDTALSYPLHTVPLENLQVNFWSYRVLLLSGPPLNPFKSSGTSRIFRAAYMGCCT